MNAVSVTRKALPTAFPFALPFGLASGLHFGLASALPFGLASAFAEGFAFGSGTCATASVGSWAAVSPVGVGCSGFAGTTAAFGSGGLSSV